MSAEISGLRSVKKTDGIGQCKGMIRNKNTAWPKDLVAICTGVVWSLLYDGSEEDPDACGYPHGQRTPERDAYYARHDTCAARARGQGS
jgi:hypothetical protein